MLHPREESTDKRFDRLTRLGILQRAAGPAAPRSAAQTPLPTSRVRERAPGVCPPRPRVVLRGVGPILLEVFRLYP